MGKKRIFLGNDLIETDINEINAVEKYINGRACSKKRTKSNEFNFVSVNYKILNENEFYEIVEANGKRNYKSAGLYQRSLFERYLEAKKENDYGYIHDIFEKAVKFRNNMKRINNLKGNKSFRKEWRKNFGKITPESILKDTGGMRSINTIENLSM